MELGGSVCQRRSVLFYNGEKEMPQEWRLRLSDAFENREARADVELTVRMLNINYGYNKQLMDKCRILEEYARLSAITREYMLAVEDRQEALNRAIDYCIENGILKEFLLKNRAEVLGMLLEEFDAEKYERTLRREGLEEGIRCSIEIMQEANLQRDSAKRKLVEKYSLSEQEAEEKLRLYWK